MFRTAALKNQPNVRLPSAAQEDKPIVLFVCVHNAGRSRMAEAFFNDLAQGRYLGRSAGTQPANRPHPEVIKAMADVGYDLGGDPGTLLTPEMADDAARIISMGCDVAEACPATTAEMADWDLPDPKGKTPEEIAEIRHQIEMRVRNLIAELDRSQL
jgi:arsenate reductase